MVFEISAAAYRDIRAALQFYQQRPGRYGVKFIHELNKALSAIQKKPRSLAPVEEDVDPYEVREYFIERFQQRVIFLVLEKQIEVLAVVHASNTAAPWLNRVAKSDNGTSTEGTSP